MNADDRIEELRRMMEAAARSTEVEDAARRRWYLKRAREQNERVNKSKAR